MELIKEAVKKAKASAPKADAGDHFTRSAPVSSAASPVENTEDVFPSGIPEVRPDASRLERHRLVSFAMTDPNHIAFNLLRTKVYKTLRDNGWNSLALTSPTAGCGKTLVTINLAFSLARQPSCRTVLIDLDLKKAGGVAQSTGITARGSIGDYLEGHATLEDCFVRVGENLVLGLNHHPVTNPAELIHSDRLKDMLRQITTLLSPDVVLFDLPPMLATDEAIAFLPHVQSSLLVVATNETTAPQIDECERHLKNSAGYLGLVLNKAATPVKKDHYYSG